jgi:hypothetical protein
VDAEEAVRGLELEPAELEQAAAERELDPPTLAQARRPVQQPVQAGVTRQVTERPPRLLVGQPPRGMQAPRLRNPREKGLHHGVIAVGVVVETKLH